ncbi:Transcription factor bhlh [Thalictrum thalictroides]|uniref:Transcription factor bhlh n=1 Tax=Thalictrum thalictroides TaxID=46969 RepID=A0A7J6XDL9_THATH|nr:Transcription factor bhlh [Thalictrum thalictroides]
MIPFKSYYGLGSCSSRDGYSSHSHSLLGSMDMVNGGGSTIISNSSTAEKKAISASKSHSEAEKRRRERINGHLRTLRTLLPNTIKTDKASLLAEVVHQVRELKKLAADVAGKDGNGCSSSSSGSSTTTSSGSGSREWIFPGESDEIIMSYCESDERSESSWSRVKVTISCEDRVDLVKDLSDAVKSVRARVVKAEMSTIGGRTKSELVIEKRRGGSEDDDSELSVLKRALKSVIDKPTVSGTNQILFGNKRQRLSHQFC